MSKPDHILFLHIPKTAGSTLHTVIQRNYKKQEHYLYNGIRYPDHLFELPEEKRASIKVLKGHIPFGRHGQLSNGSFEYFTMLRDPVARVISHYNQLLRSKGHHFYAEWEKHQYSLHELMDNGKLIYLNDMMVRMISGKLYEPWDAIGENEYQLALKNIDEHFFLAGVQDHFDAFLLMLCDHYEWKLPYYRKQQVARAAQKKAVIDEATIEAIKAHNQYDQRLYELVKKRFEEKMEVARPAFKKRLERFQRINSRIEKVLNALPFIPPPRGD